MRLSQVSSGRSPGEGSGDGSNEGSGDGYPAGYPKLFWVGLAVGGLVMAVGARGLLINSGAVMDTNPSRSALLAVVANVVHDVVLVPVVFLIGFVLSRVVPRRIRAVIQGAVICSAIAVFYATPLVLGYGVQEANPTILPRDYGQGLLIVLALIWMVTIIVGVVVFRRRRRQPV